MKKIFLLISLLSLICCGSKTTLNKNNQKHHQTSDINIIENETISKKNKNKLKKHKPFFNKKLSVRKQNLKNDNDIEINDNDDNININNDNIETNNNNIEINNNLEIENNNGINNNNDVKTNNDDVHIPKDDVQIDNNNQKLNKIDESSSEKKDDLSQKLILNDKQQTTSNNNQITEYVDEDRLNEYNLLTNYHESYQKQVDNMALLIKKNNQRINQTSENELFYQHLNRRIVHKFYWLTNNVYLRGYRFVYVINVIFLISYLITLYNHYFEKYRDNDSIFKRNSFTLFNCEYDYIDQEFNHADDKTKRWIYFFKYFPFFYFFITFWFDGLSFFYDYLANSIHYLFTKYTFKNDYSLPKHQACYFYYDHCRKTIINNEKYFTIPFLFTNNNSLITNFFDIILNLANLTTAILSIMAFFKKNTTKCFLAHIPTRIFVFTFIFVKFFSLINIFCVHLLGENNFFNQFKLNLTRLFKSIANLFTNNFYVQKHNYIYQSSSFLGFFLAILSIAFLFFCGFITELAIRRYYLEKQYPYNDYFYWSPHEDENN